MRYALTSMEGTKAMVEETPIAYIKRRTKEGKFSSIYIEQSGNRFFLNDDEGHPLKTPVFMQRFEAEHYREKVQKQSERLRYWA